jgi:hypothetical protein
MEATVAGIQQAFKDKSLTCHRPVKAYLTELPLAIITDRRLPPSWPKIRTRSRKLTSTTQYTRGLVGPLPEGRFVESPVADLVALKQRQRDRGAKPKSWLLPQFPSQACCRLSCCSAGGLRAGWKVSAMATAPSPMPNEPMYNQA